MGIEYSIHIPSDFISTNVCQLLPEWLVPVLSVLIVLQHCPVFLGEKTAETEFHKQQLRAQFVQLGRRIVLKLNQLNYQAEIFDPRTGFPLLSQPGSLRLDDVAVIKASLDYPLTEIGGCWIIDHPTWGSAVFPSVLLSAAEPYMTQAVVEEVLSTYPC
jgi:hypothetical protein